MSADAAGQDAAPLLSILVLTFNEELNLPHCLASLEGLNAEVFVVDSGSTDRTAAIAAEYGAQVVQHRFENQARQINWALETLPFRSQWILRLDADERLTPELARELLMVLPATSASVTGFLIRRRVYFWGQWIKHGGYYPIWLLRAWRTGKGDCEDLWMDEHIRVHSGEVARLSHDIIDENRKGLFFWIEKHNRFSDREVLAILLAQHEESAEGIGGQASRKRALKRQVYSRAPRFLRAVLYWAFRYFILLGFLDGKAGFVFHFLQGFWYRMVVDAKLLEHDRNAASGALRPNAPLQIAEPR